MARPDNTAVLLEAGQRRSEQARRRTLDAIASLAAAGEEVTPTSVARRAGVSRQWLYTVDEAREAMRVARLIEPDERVVPPDQRPSAASLQRRVEVLTDDNQRLRQRVDELEQRLAAVYGEWRSARPYVTHRVPAPTLSASAGAREGHWGGGAAIVLARAVRAPYLHGTRQPGQLSHLAGPLASHRPRRCRAQEC